MKNMFNCAMRTTQSGSDVKLNFRQAERHMPEVCDGNATENTEYKFKMEDQMVETDFGQTDFGQR